MLSLYNTIVGLISPYRTIALVGSILALLGGSFATGVMVRGAFCDAAEAKRELKEQKQLVQDLKDTLKQWRRLAAADAERAKKDAETAREQEVLIDELESVPASNCGMSADVADRVLRAWKR